MHNFATLWVDHLENTGELNDTHLPNVDILYYTIPKSNALCSRDHGTPKKKSLTWKMSSLLLQIFQNSSFCLKAKILSLETNTASCFPWSERITSFIFENRSTRYPTDDPPIFHVKMVFQEKATSSLVAWTVVACCTSSLYTLPTVPQVILRRHILKSWNLIKIFLKVKIMLLSKGHSQMSGSFLWGHSNEE